MTNVCMLNVYICDEVMGNEACVHICICFSIMYIYSDEAMLDGG